MSIRNGWSRAIQQFFKQTSTLNKNKIRLVGEDHLGNKYFETERPNHSRRFQRYFEKKSYDGITDVADIVSVPPAWDAWLRFRRQNPPTESEVRESEEYYQTNQARSAENKAPECNDTKELPKRPFPKLPFRG